jgi:hypothetical protein
MQQVLHEWGNLIPLLSKLAVANIPVVTAVVEEANWAFSPGLKCLRENGMTQRIPLIAKARRADRWGGV